MASRIVVLPDPVGPVRANKSAPWKSTTVRSRKAPKPTSSSRCGRIGFLEQLFEQRQNRLVGPPALTQVLGKELARRAAEAVFGGHGGLRGFQTDLAGGGEPSLDLLVDAHAGGLLHDYPQVGVGYRRW